MKSLYAFGLLSIESLRRLIASAVMPDGRANEIDVLRQANAAYSQRLGKMSQEINLFGVERLALNRIIEEQCDMKQDLAEENARLLDVIKAVQGAVKSVFAPDEPASRGDLVICDNAEDSEGELEHCKIYKVKQVIGQDLLLHGVAQSYLATRFSLFCKAEDAENLRTN